jgi:hypothetical protein
MQATKMWDKEEIKDLILKSNKMVQRSLVKLFEKQTEDEKMSEETKEHNGVGFNGVDSKFLTSLAKQVQQGRTLSEKQMTHARKKLVKYSGQLTKIANGEI